MLCVAVVVRMCQMYLIFLPNLSRTMAWRYTVVNGSTSVSSSPIMTILATQKNRMSCPVSSSDPG